MTLAQRNDKISYIFFTIIASALILFRIPTCKLLNLILVEPLFSSFESGVLIDYIFLILLSFLSIWLSKEFSWQTISKLFIYILIIYLIEYLNGYWYFTPTSVFPRLNYWGITVIFLFLSIPLNLLLRKGKQKLLRAASEGFIEDNAVVNYEEDYFNRKTVAKEIAQFIENTNNIKSFAIGILGEYGSGKTSFLNLIDLSLDKNKVLKICFDPWSTSSPQSIRREFFDLLATEVTLLDSKISSAIYSYGRKLANLDSSSTKWLNWLRFLQNQDAVQSTGEYQQINKMLRSIDRKIVIKIDDLDRLYPDEIMEVLKLIRNTGNFSNVFYLVGYDKSYVQSSLKKINDSNEFDYLDKIFQLEVPLPKAEENDILGKLQEYLKDIISENHYKILLDKIIPYGLQNRYDKNYKKILRQGRDVVRFVNGFKIIYKLIGEEVDFECLLLLELIKFRFPFIYNLIYIRADKFLYQKPVRSTHEQYYIPKMVNNGGEITTVEVSAFKIYIEKLDWLNADDVILLNDLFLTLFKGAKFDIPKEKNSISYPLYFEIYFRYRLSQNDLSDREFKLALTSPPRMQAYMQFCANHNLHKELMTRLLQEDISRNRNNFEQMINWIFSFARTFVEKEGIYRFDYGALIDKIYNYNDLITDSLYKKNKETYIKYIKSLFDRAQLPFLFETELMFQIKQKGNGFVITPEEITKYQLSYFVRYAETDHGLNKDVVWIFWGAREYYRLPGGSPGSYTEHWKFQPELVSKMKLFLTYKDSKEFLRFSIHRDIRQQSIISIYKVVLDMFDKPSELKKMVEDNPALNEDIKREYLELFDKLAAKNFKEPIEMELITDLKTREAER